MKPFSLIKKIDLRIGDSWRHKKFITVDIDWAPDYILEDTLNLIEKSKIPATFFVTHETVLLERIRANSNWEIGIHPNFNFLLEGDFRYGKNIDEVLEYYHKIVPEALSVRSHSMTQSSKILDAFTTHGLKFDCNIFIPQLTDIELKPWKHWNSDLIRIPYSWEDDICFLKPAVNLNLDQDQFKFCVYDFHPVHLYLNTSDTNHYYKISSKINNADFFSNEINATQFGARDFFTHITSSL